MPSIIRPCGGAAAKPTYDAQELGGNFSGGSAILPTATPQFIGSGTFATSDPGVLVFAYGSYTAAGQTRNVIRLTDATYTYVYHVQARIFWPLFAGYRSVTLGVSNPGTNLGFDLPSKVYGSDATEDAVQTVTMIFRAFDGVQPQSVLVWLEQRSGVNQTIGTGSPSFSPLVIAQAIPDTL